MKHFGIVYVVRNKVNGMTYVGSTKMSLGRRWACHKKAARNGASWPLAVAIREEGPEAFDIAIVNQDDTREELDAKERAVIAERNTIFPSGYNLQTGGVSGFMPHPFTVQHQAQTNAGRILSEEHKQKLRIALKGNGRGRPRTQAQRDAVSNTHRGRPKSPEQRAKMSLAARNASPEVKARRAEAIRAAFARKKERTKWQSA
jgi:group I intron endonuclease